MENSFPSRVYFQDLDYFSYQTHFRLHKFTSKWILSENLLYFYPFSSLVNILMTHPELNTLSLNYRDKIDLLPLFQGRYIFCNFSNLVKILLTHPCETRNCREMSHGLMPPCLASRTISFRVESANGRPFTYAPPSWLIPPELILFLSTEKIN